MKKISIMLLVLVVALASCKKTPEVNLKYVDVERDLVTVGTTTANIQCDYTYIATLKKAYLYYGEGENEDAFTSAEMRVVQNTLYVELTGLRENTTYNYFYEFHNGFNSMRTIGRSFETEEQGTTIVLPTVVTSSVRVITTTSAKCGGEVTDDGGGNVIERGICWNTYGNPTLANSHINEGSGIGVFTAMMSELNAGTVYYVRAYATNSKGTSYGLEKKFLTLSSSSEEAPTGAINGLFSISSNKQVYFSKGNLQYQASTNTWRFAENQWNYVGEYDGNVYENGVKCSNSSISSTYEGWIDLFGWGTSGWNNGNAYYHPYDWQFVDNAEQGYGYGPTDGSYYRYDLTGEYAEADWGVHNPISNGGNTPGMWRTLTYKEWSFFLYSRPTETGIRFVKAQVNGVFGAIFFPDDWNQYLYDLVGINDEYQYYNINVISDSLWTNVFEANGAVFLPAAGRREGLVIGVQYGAYCSSTNYSFYDNTKDIWFLVISGNELATNISYRKYCGWSVRLVHDKP